MELVIDTADKVVRPLQLLAKLLISLQQIL